MIPFLSRSVQWLIVGCVAFVFVAILAADIVVYGDVSKGFEDAAIIAGVVVGFMAVALVMMIAMEGLTDVLPSRLLAWSRRRKLDVLARRLGLRAGPEFHDVVEASGLPLVHGGVYKRIDNILVSDDRPRAIEFDYAHDDLASREARLLGAGRFGFANWTAAPWLAAAGHRMAHYSCGLVFVGSQLPRLVVVRRGHSSTDRLDEVEFESDEFNQVFSVATDDPRFANAFLDQRMMEWVLEQGPDWVFETAGGMVLACTLIVAPKRVGIVVDQAREFASRIPRVISSLYPESGVASTRKS